MIQENEVINLLMGVAAIPALYFLSRYGRLPRLPWLYAAFGALMGAYVFTVAEGFLWTEALNLSEHLCLALAGTLLCVAFHSLCRGTEEDQGPP